MRSLRKKVVVYVLAFLMLVTGILTVNTTEVQAAKKVKVTSVSAKYCGTGKLTLAKGKTYSLGAYVTPSNASNKKLSYKSSKSSVVTVNSKGKLTAKKTGKTKITITAKDGSKKKKTITVTVVDGKKFKKAKKIKFEKSTYEVLAGKTVATKVVFNPSGASNKNLKYSTSKSSIATVDNKGVVTAKKAGTVKITATTLDGSKKKATTTVKVSVLASGVTINGDSTVDLNKTLQLSATVSPKEVSNKNVSWTSSNNSVATVDANGLVRPKTIGNVTIKATAQDGSGISASKTITVKPVYMTVKFNTNGGAAIDEQSVLYNTVAFCPEAPLKQGFVFENWYTDTNCTKLYDFNRKVTSNLTLYAKYKPIVVNVSISPDTTDVTQVERNLTTKVTSNTYIEKVEYILKTDSSSEKETDELELTNSVANCHINLEDGNNVFEVVVTTNEGTETKKAITMQYDRGYIVNTMDASGYNWGEIENVESQEMSLTMAEIEKDKENDDKVTVGSETGAAIELLKEETELQIETKSAGTDAVKYLKNMLLVFFDSDVSLAEIDRIASQIGEKVGYLNSISMYQIKLDQDYTYEELIELCEEYESEYSGIAGCAIDTAYNAEYALDGYTPNDPNDGSALWWQQKIDLSDAWDYKNVNNVNYFSRIKLGVVDSGFEESHDDLKNKINIISSEKSAANHGTHVAGIMAAEMNNGKGIAGVVDNCELLASDAVKASNNYFTTSWIADGVVNLVEKGAKVVNLSLGSSGSLDDNTKSKWQIVINYEGSKYSKIIGKLLERDFDFIIVQSAGNGAKDHIGVDAINNGDFCTVTEDNCYSSREVSKADIMNRILIVANLQEDGKLSKSSNGGNQVDIAAPGTNIYSTITGNTYAYLSGTSMAAPIVSGVCGLTWSANTSLTGEQVADIVRNNTKGIAYDNNDSPNAIGDFDIVNAKLAVEEAIDRLPEVSGKFVNASTGYGMQATYKIHKWNPMKFNNNFMDDEILGSGSAGLNSSSNGTFTLPRLPYGTYVLEITANDFVTNYFTFAVKKSDVGDEVYLDNIPLSKTVSENTYRIVLRWGATPRDLDSHFRATALDGSDVHVYYSHKRSDVADLDVDDTSSYGPETITIYDISKVANVKYAVHNYTNRYSNSGDSTAGNLSKSGAYVQVYKGNRLIRRFNVPAGEGTLWTVFAINSNGTITGINSLGFQSSPYSVLSATLEDGAKTEGFDELKDYELLGEDATEETMEETIEENITEEVIEASIEE